MTEDDEQTGARTGAPTGAEPREPAVFTRRRAPRYRSFAVTGGLIGLVVGLVLALSNPADGDYSVRTIAGYLGVSLMLIGALLGLGVAVLAERRR